MDQKSKERHLSRRQRREESLSHSENDFQTSKENRRESVDETRLFRPLQSEALNAASAKKAYLDQAPAPSPALQAAVEAHRKAQKEKQKQLSLTSETRKSSVESSLRSRADRTDSYSGTSSDSFSRNSSVNLQSDNFSDESDDEDYRFERESHELPRQKTPLFFIAFIPILIVSFLVSLTFYSFPLFHLVANSSASEMFYVGQAMWHGITPYNDFYSSAGPLYFLCAQVGAIGGSTLFCWLIQLLALFISGIFAYKILFESTEAARVSLVVAIFTVITAAGLSMGGSSPMLLGLPFALYGLFISNGFIMDEAAHKDEVLIIYGMAGAVAGLISPLYFVLWLIAGVALFARAIRYGLIGRAFYQLLTSIFGFLVVCAIAGYWTLTRQFYFSAIEQAYIFPFTHFHLGISVLENLAIALALLLLFGLLVSWIYGFEYMTISGHQAWAGALSLGALAIVLVMSFQYGFSPSSVLIILPFVFMFMGLHIVVKGEEVRSTAAVIGSYLRRTLTLPIFGIIFMIGFPLVNSYLSKDTYSSEQAVASYIKANTKSSDKIIVLNDDYNINLLSDRLSETTQPPSYYPKSYQDSFGNSLSTGDDKFIVISDTANVSKTDQKAITTNYKVVNFKDSNFKIYEKK